MEKENERGQMKQKKSLKRGGKQINQSKNKGPDVVV